MMPNKLKGIVKLNNYKRLIQTSSNFEFVSLRLYNQKQKWLERHQELGLFEVFPGLISESRSLGNACSKRLSDQSASIAFSWPFLAELLLATSFSELNLWGIEIHPFLYSQAHSSI